MDYVKCTMFFFCLSTGNKTGSVVHLCWAVGGNLSASRIGFDRDWFFIQHLCSRDWAVSTIGRDGFFIADIFIFETEEFCIREDDRNSKAIGAWSAV